MHRLIALFSALLLALACAGCVVEHHHDHEHHYDRVLPARTPAPNSR